MTDNLTSTWPMALRHHRFHHLRETCSTSQLPLPLLPLLALPEENEDDIPLSSTHPDWNPVIQKNAKVQYSFNAFDNDQLDHDWSCDSPSSPSRFFHTDIPSYLSDSDAASEPIIGEDGDDHLVTFYAALLRHHFPLSEGWIIERNYPLWVFSDKFFMKDPTTRTPHDDGQRLDEDHQNYNPSLLTDLSYIPLVVEHSSCPGEPVFVLDIVPSRNDNSFTNPEEDTHQMFKMSLLLDIMGWQLNDQPQCFVMSVFGLDSWVGAKVQRGGRAKHSDTTIIIPGTPFNDDDPEEYTPTSWLEWVNQNLDPHSSSCIPSHHHRSLLKSPTTLDDISITLLEGIPEYSSDDDDALSWVFGSSVDSEDSDDDYFDTDDEEDSWFE